MHTNKISSNWHSMYGTGWAYFALFHFPPKMLNHCTLMFVYSLYVEGRKWECTERMTNPMFQRSLSTVNIFKRKKENVCLLLWNIGRFSPVYMPWLAFGIKFKVTGGFQKQIFKPRRLTESRSKLPQEGFWKEFTIEKCFHKNKQKF